MPYHRYVLQIVRLKVGSEAFCTAEMTRDIYGITQVQGYRSCIEIFSEHDLLREKNSARVDWFSVGWFNSAVRLLMLGNGFPNVLELPRAPVLRSSAVQRNCFRDGNVSESANRSIQIFSASVGKSR